MTSFLERRNYYRVTLIWVLMVTAQAVATYPYWRL